MPHVNTDLVETLLNEQDIPAPLLRALAERTCAAASSHTARIRLFRRAELLDAAMLQRLLGTYADDHPGVWSRGLLATRSVTDILEAVSTGRGIPDRVHLPGLRRDLAQDAHDPDLLTALVESQDMSAEVVLEAATNPACPPAARVHAVRTLGVAETVDVLRGGDGAFVDLLLAEVDDPAAYRVLAERTDLSAAAATALIRRWLAPTVRAADLDRQRAVRRLLETTGTLIAQVPPDVAAEAVNLWLERAAAAEPDSWAATMLPGWFVGAGLPPGLTTMAQFTSAEHRPALREYFLTRAGAVCGDDAHAWTVLLALAEGFTGTLDDLFMVTEATLSRPR